MQVCTSLQTDNHASTPQLSFLQAGCPSCRPTNSVKALKAYSKWHKKNNKIMKKDRGLLILTVFLKNHASLAKRVLQAINSVSDIRLCSATSSQYGMVW